MKKITIYIVFLGMLFACSNVSTNKEEAGLSPVLLSDSDKLATCVSLVPDEKDQPVITWCETASNSKDKHFYLAFFDESNSKFLDRVAIPIEETANLHEEGMPKIAIKGDGTIIAVYETSAPTEKNTFAGYVHYIISADRGKTWTAPQSLHADTTAGTSHSFAAITRLNDGEIGACWLDESFDKKIAGRPVKFAKTNGDNKFVNELTVDFIACQCCRIAMSSNSNGKLYVAYRDIISDSVRDMSIITSPDNGKSFSLFN